MELIDWRELYAANRAAIEGRAPMASAGVFERAPAPDALPMERRGLTGPGSGRALGSPPPLGPPAGLVRLEYHDGGRARPVYVHVPPDQDPTVAAPLVVMLHG